VHVYCCFHMAARTAPVVADTEPTVRPVVSDQTDVALQR